MRTVNVAPVRKPSDSDITDAKRASIDRKQLSPEERKVRGHPTAFILSDKS